MQFDSSRCIDFTMSYLKFSPKIFEPCSWSKNISLCILLTCYVLHEWKHWILFTGLADRKSYASNITPRRHKHQHSNYVSGLPKVISNCAYRLWGHPDKLGQSWQSQDRCSVAILLRRKCYHATSRINTAFPNSGTIPSQEISGNNSTVYIRPSQSEPVWCTILHHGISGPQSSLV